MQRSITLLLALGALAGFAAHASAQDGVTLVNPEDAAKVRSDRQGGITLAASNGDAIKVERKRRKAGQVFLSVKDADLAKTVLPLIEEQVGVKIKWRGPKKSVSLRLVQPVDWEDALALICQFTNTHSALDGNGRIVLKRTWAGFVNDEKAWDDLGGQVKTPERIQRRALLASVRRTGRRMPVSRHRNVIPTIRLGGGTLNFNSRGRPAQPYQSNQPYASPAPPAPSQRARNPQPGFGG